MRASLRFVCRVMIAIGFAVVSAPDWYEEHRDGAHPRRSLLVPVGRRGVDDPTGLERVGDLLPPLRLDLLADEVPVEEGRGARGPRVRDRDERARLRRHPQHDVGEGEVGEELPVADEQVQPLDVGVGRATVPE
jgi:hypothetical protein